MKNSQTATPTTTALVDPVSDRVVSAEEQFAIRIVLTLPAQRAALVGVHDAAIRKAAGREQEKREKLWKEYVDLAAEDVQQAGAFASVHGFRVSTPKRIQRGKEIRRELGIDGVHTGLDGEEGE